MKKLLFIAFLIAFNTSLFSQIDYGWWNRTHNWDGVTHWTNYITISPELMGPNALPVPDFKNGQLKENPNLKLAYENHYSTGDKTQDLFTELYIPLYSSKVGLNISMIPVEYHEMDTKTRDLRRTRVFDGKGFSSGDLYLGTYIQVVKDKKGFPDILLTINLKTASGNNFESARFTETPGYFFDISFGKTFKTKGLLKSIRPFGMGGMYVWQTHRDDYYQNDAMLYGVGFDLNFSKFEIKNSFGGYNGYIRNGDNPLVYRLAFNSKLKSVVNYEISFQKGFVNSNYTTIRLGCNMDLSFFKKKNTENKTSEK